MLWMYVAVSCVHDPCVGEKKKAEKNRGRRGGGAAKPCTVHLPATRYSVVHVRVSDDAFGTAVGLLRAEIYCRPDRLNCTRHASWSELKSHPSPHYDCCRDLERAFGAT